MSGRRPFLVLMMLGSPALRESDNDRWSFVTSYLSTLNRLGPSDEEEEERDRLFPRARSYSIDRAKWHLKGAYVRKLAQRACHLSRFFGLPGQ